MEIIMLSLFAIATCIHLYASLKKNKKIRSITKPFIVLSLIGWYLFAAEKIDIIIVLALFFGWLGDILLIPGGNKAFAIGGVSFLIGHIFLVIRYSKYIDYIKIPLVVIILLVILFIGAVAYLFRILKPYLPKNLFYPMAVYLFVNGLMNCFATFRMISNFSLPTALTFVGALLFFASDSILFIVRFKKNTRIKTHFLVMLTYSLAELLIVLGVTNNLL